MEREKIEIQEESETEEAERVNLIPAASISLALSTLLPAQFLPPKQIGASPPNKVKIPSQISSLSYLSASQPAKSSSKSTTISANPLHGILTLNPLRPANPSNAAAFRRACVVWFRNDLRVSDNECLTSANNDAMSVLPVYCFDPRDYGKSSSGFDKTGPYRANFLIESVTDLRMNLQARGSDLVVRIGKPENVLLEVVKAVGADAVYMHREVSHDEVKAEEKIEEIMKEEGVEVKCFWGSTLYHLDDLPFELEAMPTNYGGLKEKVQGIQVRKTIEALDRMKSLPKRGDVEPGEIPTLADLGLGFSCQTGETGARPSVVGGETEALKRLNSFGVEGQTKAMPNKESSTSIYGANFSCKISPWLAVGCLSPRSLFHELKKKTASRVSAKQGGGGGGDWLMYELLWRDFFRFITRKYSCKKQLSYEPVTPAAACT